MPNPSNRIQPLSDKRAPRDSQYQLADGTWDVALMNADWADGLASGKARRKEEAVARRRKPVPEPVKPEDYPWLKPDWVEAPVRPFKR